MPPLTGLRKISLGSRFYKHFVPTGLSIRRSLFIHFNLSLFNCLSFVVGYDLQKRRAGGSFNVAQGHV
jgi:hypothetical protein